jgi:hypothetical protein
MADMADPDADGWVEPEFQIPHSTSEIGIRKSEFRLGGAVRRQPQGASP